MTGKQSGKEETVGENEAFEENNEHYSCMNTILVKHAERWVKRGLDLAFFAMLAFLLFQKIAPFGSAETLRYVWTPGERTLFLRGFYPEGRRALLPDGAARMLAEPVYLEAYAPMRYRTLAAIITYDASAGNALRFGVKTTEGDWTFAFADLPETDGMRTERIVLPLDRASFAKNTVQLIFSASKLNPERLPEIRSVELQYAR